MRKEGSDWENPSIIVFSLPPTKNSLLIFETLDKLALVMETGGAGGKGMAGGAWIQHQERRAVSNAIR